MDLRSVRPAASPFHGKKLTISSEGVASVILGLFAFYWIQGDPEKSHRWLSEDEQRFIILRNKFGYGADKGGNQLLGFSFKDFASAIKASQLSRMHRTGLPLTSSRLMFGSSACPIFPSASLFTPFRSPCRPL